MKIPHIRRNIIRLIWIALGAAVGISVTLVLVGPTASPFLLASLGGTTVYLFAVTRDPAVQPRALFGGHLSGVFIGIICYRYLGEALWVYVLAIVLTMGCMLLTKTLHAPAVANPLIMIQAHAGFVALWHPILVCVFALAVIAFIWTRLVPGMVHYPVAWFERSPSSTFLEGWND